MCGETGSSPSLLAGRGWVFQSTQHLSGCSHIHRAVWGGRSRTGPVYFRVWLRFLAVPLTCLLSSTIFSSRVMCGQEPPCERCLCSAEGQQPPAPVPSRDTHVQRSSLGTVAMVTDLVTANSTN